MNQSKDEIQKLHEEGLLLAQNYLKCEARMVQILSEMSANKGFYLFNCESLLTYARCAWNLPEHTARDMVTVAHRAVEVPQMLEALKTGNATVSKLRRVCSVIDSESANDWLGVVANCTSREIEKAVAMANETPEEIIERMRYKTAHEIELVTGISEELMLEIQRLRDLLAKEKYPSIAEAIQAAVGMALDKLDPKRKAQRKAKNGTCRVQNDSASKSDEANQKSKSNKKKSRRALPASVRHALNVRDQSQCSHTNLKGERCSNRKWLHVHHIKPISEGGDDSLDNLQTICGAHHRLLHRGVSHIVPTIGQGVADQYL